LIASLIPDFDEFREPFVGGGSVFLHVKQLSPGKEYWINDLYYQLYNFWKMSQQEIDDVVAQVWKWRKEFPVGKQLHRFLIDSIERLSPVQQASAFFIFNRITFSGTSESGGFSEAAFRGRFTATSIERLQALAPILRGTKITNFDYQLLVEAEGTNVFLFLDPPYFSATQSALYGKNGHLHKSFNHERLAEVMKRCPHRWLITYDDSPYIRKLFPFANITRWNLMYGMRNQTATSDQRGKELFISNYQLNRESGGFAEDRSTHSQLSLEKL
jgi:DNA adenine methylase